MSPRTPRPFPGTLPTYAFRVREAKQLGVTKGELERVSVRTLSRGIRIVSGEHPPDEKNYWEMVATIMAETPNAIASHISAARLHRFPIPEKYPITTVRSHGHAKRYHPWYAAHITMPRGIRAPRRKGVIGYSREVDPSEIAFINQTPVTSIPRTLLDMTQWLKVNDLIVVLDSLFSQGERSFSFTKDARLTREQLEAYLELKKGHPGIRKLRAAMARAIDRADSPPETRLRLALEDAGLPRFHANIPILDEQGQPVCWSDLSNHEYMVCVEYEGAHHLSGDQLHRDSQRDYTVHAAGWLQVKLTKVDMRDPSIAVAKVRMALIRRGWNPKG